jgi:hypothetical protein
MSDESRVGVDIESGDGLDDELLVGLDDESLVVAMEEPISDRVMFVADSDEGPVWEGSSRLRLQHCSVIIAWSRRSYPDQASRAPVNSAYVSEREEVGRVERLCATEALQCSWSRSRSGLEPSQRGPKLI